jgi:hypothetical protein
MREGEGRRGKAIKGPCKERRGNPIVNNVFQFSMLKGYIIQTYTNTTKHIPFSFLRFPHRHPASEIAPV